MSSFAILRVLGISLVFSTIFLPITSCKIPVVDSLLEETDNDPRWDTLASIEIGDASYLLIMPTEEVDENREKLYLLEGKSAIYPAYRHVDLGLFTIDENNNVVEAKILDTEGKSVGSRYLPIRVKLLNSDYFLLELGFKCKGSGEDSCEGSIGWSTRFDDLHPIPELFYVRKSDGKLIKARRPDEYTIDVISKETLSTSGEIYKLARRIDTDQLSQQGVQIVGENYRDELRKISFSPEGDVTESLISLETDESTIINEVFVDKDGNVLYGVGEYDRYQFRPVTSIGKYGNKADISPFLVGPDGYIYGQIQGDDENIYRFMFDEDGSIVSELYGSFDTNRITNIHSYGETELVSVNIYEYKLTKLFNKNNTVEEIELTSLGIPWEIKTRPDGSEYQTPLVESIIFKGDKAYFMDLYEDGQRSTGPTKDDITLYKVNLTTLETEEFLPGFELSLDGLTGGPYKLEEILHFYSDDSFLFSCTRLSDERLIYAVYQESGDISIFDDDTSKLLKYSRAIQVKN